ncbi:unnamed protein product [Rotaria sordida]|uniref:Exonuclease V n=1 Tax=Rotaria sordida TaxID=392033 RepID=A0A819K3A5_9BILA|nr:unnamed protein product [Rotaria sordida]CAF0940773.1 unnamed protein product [Rotaria sordida]CAF1085674.1 unnamed protein product [Rotaria sordida]CAF3942008.1 unnamed protein product [Rotaria sordida]
MHQRQIIFQSVLPNELDPARFSKPIIDGIEQPLTITSMNGECTVQLPLSSKINRPIKDDFDDDELVAYAENLENIPEKILLKEDRKKKDIENNPLYKYRHGILSVSDISSQIWCEQQLTYKFLYPFILNDDGEIKRVDDKIHMLRGTSLHLDRELEIQIKVSIECQTREDSYGIRLLNMIQAIHGLLTWNKHDQPYITREMPIFGNMYGGKLYFRGIIDEINYDPRTNQLEVVEFKTRASKTTPKPQQTYTHKIQVNIYRTLLDELIQGQVDKTLYFQRFNLEPTTILSDSILNQYNQCGFTQINTLENAFDLLIKLAFQMPTITTNGAIEYILQSDPTWKNRKEFDRDENNLKELLIKSEGYWLGKREAEGVDIEDAYKCQWCDYKEMCTWREEKSNEFSRKKRRIN